MRFKSTGAFAAMALMSIAAARAGAPQPYSDDLSLDWDGVHSAWLDKGVDVRIGYVSETATNVQGGDRELVRYTDQITFSAMLDLEKLLGLKQATFKLSITDRNGNDLSNDANLQSLQQVQELYGRDQTWRWTQFWYQQKYFDGLVTWKVGRITDVQGSEYVAELFYSLHINRWLDLRPNVQYIAQPGGVARNTDDVIVGLRVTINL